MHKPNGSTEMQKWFIIVFVDAICSKFCRPTTDYRPANKKPTIVYTVSLVETIYSSLVNAITSPPVV